MTMMTSPSKQAKLPLDEGAFFSRFMFMSLHHAARQWAWMFSGSKMHPKIETRLNNLLNAEKEFFKALKSVNGGQEREDVYDGLAQIFSDCLLKIKNAETIEEKRALLTIMTAYASDNGRIVEGDREVIEPFVQHLKERIKIDYTPLMEDYLNNLKR